MTARYSALENAHERLARLGDISKLLTKREHIERTVSSILGIAAGVLPLRSAILIRQAGDAAETLAWKAEDIDEERLGAVKARARTSFEYLAGRSITTRQQDAPSPSSSRLPGASARPPAHSSDTSKFVLLPLVVERGPVFGAVQLEADGPLDESDLAFVNSMVNQLAVALDRDSAIATAQAAVEARRAEAERAEKRAQSQLEFTRSITESLGEGIVTINLTGHITFVNPAAATLLGCTEEDAIGKHVADVMQLRRAGGSHQPEAPLFRAMQTTESSHSDAYEMIGRSVQPFPVSETSSPILRDGAIAGAVLVFRSIAPMKEAERRTRFLAEASDVLSWSLDTKATLKRVARLPVPFLADVCFIDEVDAQGETRRRELALTHDTRRRVARRIRSLASTSDWHTPQAAVIASGRPVLLSDLERKDGAPEASREQSLDPDARPPGGSRYADVMRALGLGSMMIVPLVARGRTRGALTFALLASGRRYGMTDLRVAEEMARRAAVAIDNVQLQEETQRAVRQRQDILEIVSHDLRNPLNVIHMSLSLLSRHSPATDRRLDSQRVLSRVHRAVERMDHLINDLLALSVIESGQLSIEVASHAVLDFAREAMESLRLSAAREGVRLDSSIAETEQVSCDRDRILQVLTNILGNAVKFTPEGPVTLRIARRQDEILFAITDAGPGMPAAVVAHVFERYWQAQETASRGTGLGLYISKAIVEAHGGRIWAESALGRGSTFYFTLPAIRPRSSHDVAPRA